MIYQDRIVIDLLQQSVQAEKFRLVFYNFGYYF